MLKLLTFNCQASSQTISHRVAHRLTKIGVDCRYLCCDRVFKFFCASRAPPVEQSFKTPYKKKSHRLRSRILGGRSMKPRRPIHFSQNLSFNHSCPLYHSGPGRDLAKTLFFGVVQEAKTFLSALPGKINIGVKITN